MRIEFDEHENHLSVSVVFVHMVFLRLCWRNELGLGTWELIGVHVLAPL